MLGSLVFSSRMILLASRYRANMLSGTFCTLLACTQFVSKTDGIPLRSSGMAAFQGLGNRFSLFAFVGASGGALGELLGRLATFSVRSVRPLLVLVRVVCRAASMVCRRRQHKICHRHVSFQSFYIGIQWISCCYWCLQRASEQLAHPDKKLSVGPQQLGL